MVYSLNPLVEDVIDVWSVNVVCCVAFSVVTALFLTLVRMRSEDLARSIMMITQGAAHTPPHPRAALCLCECERHVGVGLSFLWVSSDGGAFS